LNNQYVHKVRCLEKDGKAKAERIQQLQEKNMQAVVQTPGNARGAPERSTPRTWLSKAEGHRTLVGNLGKSWSF